MSNLVSVGDAATTLDTSTTQIYRLLDSGDLRGRRLGTQRVVFAEALNEYRLTRPSPGRPAEPSAAWAKLLAARPTALDELGPLAATTRRRAATRYCHVLPYRLAEIATSVDHVVSGPLGANRHGAHTGATEPLHIYVRESRWSSTQRTLGVTEAEDDLNLIARVVPDAAWPFAPSQVTAPLIACAVDAYAAADLRSAHEALTRMQESS